MLFCDVCLFSLIVCFRMVVLTLACRVATSSDPLLPRPVPLPTRPETAEGVEGEEEEEEGGPEHRQIDQQVRPTTRYFYIQTREGSCNQLSVGQIGKRSLICL